MRYNIENILQRLIDVIQLEYPELSSSEIRRLFKQNAIKIRPDTKLTITESNVFEDEIDEKEYEIFLKNPENCSMILCIGKRKQIYLKDYD